MLDSVKIHTDDDGLFHRDRDGKLHREDGPAVIRPDGRQEWWVYGKRVDPMKHLVLTSQFKSV